MNPPSDLQALMALDALGEATPEQQAELRRQLAAEAALAAQHAALRDTAARVADSAAAFAPPTPLPASVLARMEDARTRALAHATATHARAGGAGNVVAFPGPGAVPASARVATAPAARVTRSRSRLQLLAWAAVIGVLATPAMLWLTRGPENVIATASPALAPRGETGMTQPTLVWENAAGQDYDVWILPEGADQQSAAALFVANEVRSPVTFSTLKPGPANPEKAPALKPGTRYLALVCLAGKGRMAGVTVAFETSPAAIGAPPSPTDAATALTLIRQLLDTGRSSDALMVLSGLPEPVRALPEVTALETRIRSSLK